MVLEIGDVIGKRYQILDHIDIGTRAQIRSAHDLILDRKVSLKLSNDLNGMEEAQISASIEHPHLLPIYDVVEDDGDQILVMRFFNETLRDYLQRLTSAQPIPTHSLISLFQKIASAIDWLHQKGQVIHGNLKPNIIVLDTESGIQVHPYIFDFGVAALGAVGIGTPPYMAPEQAVSHKISTVVDIYAFGIIMYECFIGSHPFEGMQSNAIMYHKLNPSSDRYSVRKHRPDLPIGVDVVVDRLTRLNAKERFDSAMEAVDELVQVFYSGQSSIEGQVFISYARKDQDYVHSLAKQLRNVGVDLWIDQDIAPGTNWDQSIEEALNSCEKILIVVSPASVLSENVHDEWSYALEQGKTVYPFIYQECDIPFRLRRRQHIVSTGDLLTDVTRIVDILAGGTPTKIFGELEP